VPIALLVDQAGNRRLWHIPQWVPTLLVPLRGPVVVDKNKARPSYTPLPAAEFEFDYRTELGTLIYRFARVR
jgi:hypothetical protein